MKQKLTCLLIATHIMLICVILVGREPETYETRTMTVTAYCKGPCCCGKYADGITASGHKIKPGDKLCAAGKSIPFGTVIDVPGYGRARVEDRGSAIKDNCLDLLFDTHQAALEWGRKTLQVKIAR